MTKIPKIGSTWRGTDDSRFVVLHVVDVDNHTWIHYRDHDRNKKHDLTPNEYSCYLESFLHRFSETPDE